MKFLRFDTGDGLVRQGYLDTETQIREIKGDMFGKFESEASTYELASVKLHPPCTPSKVICVGLNYKDHAREMNLDLPAVPVIFLKPPTAVIGPEQSIIIPEMSKRVDYEAEMAIVIGREAKNLKPEEAREVIFGYTCANDVTARDLQSQDGQWTRAKAFDTFLPLGPYVVTDINDPENLKIELRLNGETKQKSSTNEMIFDVNYMVSFISRVMTLYPQDVILTGTSFGIGPMKGGDLVEVLIEKIGLLKNPVS